MELIQLKIFYNVAKYHSFTQAADNMFISQSSVSKYILALEDEIGEPLFNRANKWIILTDMGRDFYTFVQQILEDEKDMQDFVSNRRLKRANSIRIGLERSIADTVDIPSYKALVATISMMKVQFPDLQVHFEVADRSKITSLLHNKKIDFAVLTINAADVINDTAYNFCADALHKNDYYLAYSINDSKDNLYTTLEEAIFNIKTICFVSNSNNHSITSRVLSEYHINPELRPCDSTLEQYLKIISGEAVGIIDEHTLQFISACNIPAVSFPLNNSFICYSTYVLYNEFYIKSNPQLNDILEYFKIHYKLNYRVDNLAWMNDSRINN